VAPASVPGQLPATRLTLDEARLLLTIVNNIVTFSAENPIEYHSYCPTDRWESALAKVGTWAEKTEKSIAAGSRDLQISGDVIFQLIDLEKCVSASKDAKISSARWAFTLTSVAGLASWFTGMTWINVPAYIAGLALVYGRPLYAKYEATPAEPYKPVMSGRRIILGSRRSMAGCAAPEETPEEAAQVKYMERVILPEGGGTFNHYWGTVESPGNSPDEMAICLSKGRFRIHIEGFAGDKVMPATGWSKAIVCEPAALNTVAVYTVPGEPRATEFGPIPEKSRHDDNFWVEYVGPLTRGAMRRAGPFGCPFDTRDHALEDSGLKSRGRDGDFVIFDASGDVVEVSMTG
jgi:hypothetical protein